MPTLQPPLLLLLLLLLHHCPSPALPCFIQGVDSGVCVPSSSLQAEAPFCGPVLQYPRTCMPKMPVDPAGNPYYPNATLNKKDKWLSSYFDQVYFRQLALEHDNGQSATLGERERERATPALRAPHSESTHSPTSDHASSHFPPPPTPPPPTLSSASWEGTAGKILMHFTNNDACKAAFKNFLCYMNFPRCDATGTSLMLCQSVCENFYKACNYPKDFWRCYNYAYYGGQEAEPSTLISTSGEPIFLRSMLPGLPFTPNMAALDGSPAEVCTPALASGAEASAAVAAGAVALAAVALLQLL
jgi:hypothetical protein